MTYQTTNDFNITRQDGTYTGATGELVVSDGGTITLPTPTAGEKFGVRALRNDVTLLSNGSIEASTGDRRIDSEGNSVFVSDGTEWYLVSGNEYFGFDIPDSGLSNILYRYPFVNRFDSVIEETEVEQNATANGTTNINNNYIANYAEQGNGTDAYITMPTAITQWADTTGSQWFAFTIEDIDTEGDLLTVFSQESVPDGGTERWRLQTYNGSELFMRAGVGGIGGPGNNRTTWTTTNANLTSGKHRIFVQKTDADSAEFYVDGSQVSVDTNINENGWAGFHRDPTTFNLTMFARNNDYNGTIDQFTNSILDNWIFGEQGTTKSSSEIQDDYNEQPWV